MGTHGCEDEDVVVGADTPGPPARDYAGDEEQGRDGKDGSNGRDVDFAALDLECGDGQTQHWWP